MKDGKNISYSRDGSLVEHLSGDSKVSSLIPGLALGQDHGLWMMSFFLSPEVQLPTANHLPSFFFSIFFY